METKDLLTSDILNTFNEASEIDGHFCTEKVDLGNLKFGIDIFTIIKKKEKSGEEYLFLSGLYKKGVISLLEHLGICHVRENQSFILVRKEFNIISEISLKEIKDLVNDYLTQLPELNIEIDGVEGCFTSEAQTEMFYRQTNTVLNDNFLDFLCKDESPIKKDSTEKACVFFENGIVEIKAKEVLRIPYSTTVDGLIWKKNIINRQIKQRDSSSCHFSKFIENVCNKNSQRIRSLRSGLGYLMHSFQRSSGGQMVLLYDESITDVNIPQGGTGKGLISNAIAMIRNTVKIDGKKFKGNSRFDFQDVTRATKVLWIDDVSKEMDIDRFNSLSTDGFNLEQKFKDSFFILAQDSPKILICSNIILDCVGSTRKRRQFIIELSDYYSRKISSGVEEPIVEEHGCLFFTDDWDDDQYNRFYWYMIDCIQLYLDKGLIPTPSINMVENRLRQIIGEEFLNWTKNKLLKPNTEYNTKELYEEYKQLYEDGNNKFTQRAFSNYLGKYVNHMNLSIEFFTKSISGQKISFFRIINNKDKV
ncbi:MAG: hypothetical protein K9I95_06990 [Flavobacteriaceae bacterium]|nr:hypothetical protein [Flavobacteriaceae bacterium]